jgi:outer membrane protein OmpA-like peptidoglycan-associated protein
MKGVCLLVVMVCSGCAFACGPRRVAFPDGPFDLVVLLPDSPGVTGRASVSNRFGATALDEARAATTITPGRAPTAAVILDQATVTATFGEALSGLPRAPQSFLLFFPLESNELTAESRARVPEILKIVALHSVPEVVVIGHTDTTGDREANVALGRERATAVRSLLVDAGLEPSMIEVASHGEVDPLVRTPDETFEPRNRRVEVTIR